MWLHKIEYFSAIWRRTAPSSGCVLTAAQGLLAAEARLLHDITSFGSVPGKAEIASLSLRAAGFSWILCCEQ
jgi:hypothetical protein